MSGLRPLRRSDLGSLSAWVPVVAAAAGCERWSQGGALAEAVRDASVLVYGADEPEALVSFQVGEPAPGGARVEFLAAEPGRRRIGVGGRVALELEKRLARTARRLYVLVPGNLGLALYFWLRLGYRPLTGAERLPVEGGRVALWMARDLGRH
jgi:ribosomal protein S18 acetylase RimI-like enzyme